jgi:hypothetical protein
MLKLKPVTDAMRSFWRRHMRAFAPNWQIIAETYVKTGDRIHAVTEKEVSAAAAILESAYTMSEDIPYDQLIALSMTRAELHAFVSYMRQLDTAYRTQAEFLAKNIKTGPLGGKHYEFKTTEEAAQVSPECYEQLTGQSARQAASRQRDQQSPVHARDVPVAQE